FYLPRTDASYLAELRYAFDAAEVDLECFLVDDGDIVHPERGAEQQRWLDGWIQIAEQLGAPRVRVPAGGQAPTEETPAPSARRLRALAASHPGLPVPPGDWEAPPGDAGGTRDLLRPVGGGGGRVVRAGDR